MRENIKILATAVALLSSVAVSATSYLTVSDSNGSKTSFALSEKPTVSFTATSLRLVAGEQTIDYPLSEYRSFTLTDDSETTGIGAVETVKQNPVFTLGETLQGSGLESGGTVAIYNISGQLVRQARVSAQGFVNIPLNDLKGVLVVKTNNKSFKFIKK